MALQAQYDALLAEKVAREDATRAAHAEEKQNPAGYDTARVNALGAEMKLAQQAFGEFVVANPKFAPKQFRTASRAGRRQAAERRAIQQEREREAAARRFYR